MKILFVSTRQTKPSFRFRVEQVLPYYEANGHCCDVAFLPTSLWQRFSFYRQMQQFDVVVIQKRLLSRTELYLVRRYARRLVYDLDDAIMFNGHGIAKGKRFARFQAMVTAADLTICGNPYLAAQTQQFTQRYCIVPTPIDTERYCSRSYSPNSDSSDNAAVNNTATKTPVIIGWTGSRSTNRYLNNLFPVIAKLSDEKSSDGNSSEKVMVKILSDVTDDFDFSQLKTVPFEFVPWSPTVEISETATFDIGVMPLPDDPWTRGKCGFKALQYMSLGIPPVCSPVGVNRTIITAGHNGELANSPDEWFHKLRQLVHEKSLRRRLGSAARQRMEEAYALNVVGPQFVEAVSGVALPKNQQSCKNQQSPKIARSA